MSLNAAPISELTALTAPKAIFLEWLKGYFDGQHHAVGLHSGVLFPKCSFRFAINADPQPLSQSKDAGGTVEECSIRLVTRRRNEKAWHTTDAQHGEYRRVQSAVTLDFWVKAKRAGTGKSEDLCASVAQLLKAILTNPDTRFALAERGITALLPFEPEPMPTAEAALYLVTCAAEFHYAVLFNTEGAGGTGSVAGSTVVVGTWQNAFFTHEAPVANGSYLLGLAQWDKTQRILSVTARWEAGDEDVVLQLEVNGTLTGLQVTLTAGQTEVDVDCNQVLAAAALARWKVVSGPLPEDAARAVALIMSVVPA